jgi:DNA-binding transcriptional ArsR family regulator
MEIPGQVNGRVVEPFPSGEIDECRRLSRTWAPALRALGNPDRLLIVLCLAGGSRSLRELEQATGLSPSLVTYHLGQLRGAGLVIASVEGRRNRYWLHHVELDQVATLIGTRDGARLAISV